MLLIYSTQQLWRLHSGLIADSADVLVRNYCFEKRHRLGRADQVLSEPARKAGRSPSQLKLTGSVFWASECLNSRAMP